jgi:SHAQKYF class myb-like DNA-binding protein
MHTKSAARVGQATRVGRWSPSEHAVFLEGMKLYPKQWKTIAELVKTRTVVQVRTHAQKCWNEESENGNFSSVSINVGMGDFQASSLESPRKKRKSAKNRSAFDVDHVLMEEDSLANDPQTLDMHQILTEDALLSDELLKINTGYSYSNSPASTRDPTNSPLGCDQKLSGDLSALVLSPHLAANSFLCNAPEYWASDSSCLKVKRNIADCLQHRGLGLGLGIGIVS